MDRDGGAVPDTDGAEELRRAERRLQAAQLAGDVAALDQLLDDRLVATLLPSVTLVSKAEDLEAHRNGQLVLTSLVEEELVVVAVGTTGVTWVLTALEGSSAGTPFAVRMLYTRTWHHTDEHGWRVLAAHISPV